MKIIKYMVLDMIVKILGYFIVIIYYNNNVFKFEFGKSSCNNRFCYLCKILGYKIINCPKKIKSHHVHTSNIRNYNEIDKLSGPYLAVKPLDY